MINIMKKAIARPTLQEVKEYFKNAESIKSIYGINAYYINTKKLGVFETETGFRQNRCFTGNELLLWDQSKGYAKILTSIEACGIETKPEYAITKEQILRLHEHGTTIVKNWFPEAFKEDKVELVVGKWYKTLDVLKWKIYFVDRLNEDNLPLGYGFSSDGEWLRNDNDPWLKNNDMRTTVLATPEEVTEALTKEAVNRYKVGDYVKQVCHGTAYKIERLDFYLEGDRFILSGIAVFKEGKWAEILPTISKEDAEKELGKKIV
jgi:hypothetical protein